MNKIACSRCGSEKIIPRVSIVDRGHLNVNQVLSVEIEGNPEAWVFKEASTGKVMARICGDCGYTELYTLNAGDLYKKYRQSRSAGGRSR